VNDGNGFVFVDHLGEICPSGFLPMARGNVRTDDLVSIYRDDEIFRRLRDAEALMGKCGRCEFREMCGGSRGRGGGVAGEAVDDPAAPGDPLLAEHAGAGRVGLADVDDDGLARRLRDGERAPERRLLHGPGREVVVEVEAGLAHRDDARVPGERVVERPVLLGHAGALVGMDADRGAEEPGIPCGELEGVPEVTGGAPQADADDPEEPRGARARDDGVEIVGVVLGVEVGVGVDEAGLVHSGFRSRVVPDRRAGRTT
jgi:radical SAM protein with 4Fe4S-binding SPASM domain